MIIARIRALFTSLPHLEEKSIAYKPSPFRQLVKNLNKEIESQTSIQGNICYIAFEYCKHFNNNMENNNYNYNKDLYDSTDNHPKKGVFSHW